MSALRCPRCGATFDAPARFCTKDGFPLHPLRLPKSLVPVPYLRTAAGDKEVAA